MSRYKTKNKHISLIRQGDTILHNGEERTVCDSDILISSFMGISIFGDSYSMGRKLVKEITYF